MCNPYFRVNGVGPPSPEQQVPIPGNCIAIGDLPSTYEHWDDTETKVDPLCIKPIGAEHRATTCVGGGVARTKGGISRDASLEHNRADQPFIQMTQFTVYSHVLVRDSFLSVATKLSVSRS